MPLRLAADTFTHQLVSGDDPLLQLPYSGRLRLQFYTYALCEDLLHGLFCFAHRGFDLLVVLPADPVKDILQCPPQLRSGIFLDFMYRERAEFQYPP